MSGIQTHSSQYLLGYIRMVANHIVRGSRKNRNSKLDVPILLDFTTLELPSNIHFKTHPLESEPINIEKSIRMGSYQFQNVCEHSLMLHRDVQRCISIGIL